MPPTSAMPLWLLYKTFSGNTIAPRYWGRLFLSVLFSLLGAPFRLYETWRHKATIEQMNVEKDPVFVIGHWRSGTTHLHNLLSQDPQMSYVSTYHATFPGVLLSGKWLFKAFMQLFIPKRRAGDNVRIHPDYPQEEEFALGNMGYHSYYYFFFLPQKTRYYFDKFMNMKSGSDTAESWKRDYLELVKKALLNTGKGRFLSKNPPNTTRIPQLLELFPNAKFIYIYRNPVTVYLSTKKFFGAMMPYLCFEDISEAQLEKNILDIYVQMHQKYEQDKQLVPSGNLIEVSFEALEQSTLPVLENIYQSLSLPGFETAQAHFEQYAGKQKAYKKNRHAISQRELDAVSSRWGFEIVHRGYKIPDLEVH